MERQADALDDRFDVLILGGGVHGVALARTLALSGVSVALVEKGDFGGATTHNSLKIVHGGLRYVQHLDGRRIRESVQAQRAWLSAAPHLVRPMRFTMPTAGWGTRSPIALAAGVSVYQLLGGNSRRRSTPRVSMPNASVQRRQAFERMFPEVRSENVNGCMSWFDAQIRDSGRLITECVADAARNGAILLNHVEAIALRRSGNRASGALVRDCLSGGEHEVRARVTVGTLGAWGGGFARRSGLPCTPAGEIPWTRNVNVVMKRPVIAGDAVGVMSSQRGDGLIGNASRLYFITPWQGTSIIGTTHDVHEGEPEPLSVGTDEVESLLADMNSTLNGRELGLDDVASLHMGLTPSEEAGEYRAKRSLVTDYGQEYGVDGYIEVTPNKYTTAPTVSRQVAKLVLRHLGRNDAGPADFSTALPGAPQDGDDPLDALGKQATDHERERAWVRAVYGTRADEMLGLANTKSLADSPAGLFRRRVVHGVREDMAVRLGDAVFRCSDLAERGRLSLEDLLWCLDCMTRHFGWSERQRFEELELVLERLRRHLSGGPGMNWSIESETIVSTENAGERVR